MLVDSHCHLNRLDLSAFDGSLDKALDYAREQGVKRFLCVSVAAEDAETLYNIAAKHHDVDISVGVHPNDVGHQPIDIAKLTELASQDACIAIGETGLDYYRSEGKDTLQHQQTSFATHIEVSKNLKKPLIIHTREAAADTIGVMKEAKADEIGGVMHCFAESLDIAKQSIDLNFYISFSGIVTFKNARELQEVAQAVPLDRILIETDAPYLAPTPYRGKPNHPAWVYHVAKKISELRNESFETIAKITTDNFYRCFRLKENV